jgi:hypothetical protein
VFDWWVGGIGRFNLTGPLPQKINSRNWLKTLKILWETQEILRITKEILRETLEILKKTFEILKTSSKILPEHTGNP